MRKQSDWGRSCHTYDAYRENTTRSSCLTLTRSAIRKGSMGSGWKLNTYCNSRGFRLVFWCNYEAWLTAIAERDAGERNTLACYSVCDICPYGRVIPVTYVVTSVQSLWYLVCSGASPELTNIFAQNKVSGMYLKYEIFLCTSINFYGVFRLFVCLP